MCYSSVHLNSSILQTLSQCQATPNVAHVRVQGEFISSDRRAHSTVTALLPISTRWSTVTFQFKEMKSC
ncbi:hypothetical protein TYRP_019982 [Tyrophagus putrescentiae]|nr:hypothetical protein TYRP_019982 [Tyrophagus putrescentiae]